MRTSAIPRTKLLPPVLRQPIVPRPRLTAVFKPGRALTVISAPAGFGKTTLVLEGLAGAGSRVAWYSLDAEDNDPLRFLHGVFAALQMAGIKLGRLSGQRSLRSGMVSLINQLTGSEPVVLVLDDYHVIHEPAIQDVLGYLLDHLPACLQLVIITRETAPFPLARLRARHELREIDPADLRFTNEEAGWFLQQVMGLRLSAEKLSELQKYTQGWAAGLQMAGLSLQGHDAGAIPDPRGKQFLSEYLLHEILMQQEQHVQDFLLGTSLPDRFSLPLCKSLFGKGAAQLLARVQKANLFITVVGSWYQYHPLFREFLQSQLLTQFPERVEPLHRRALTWFEQNGFPEQALQHAAAVADHEKYAGLLELLAPGYLKRGELVTLRRWLETLPEEVVWRHPRLCLTQIWLLLDSNLQIEAQTYFERLGSHLEQNMQSEFLAVRALHAAMNHRPDLAFEFAGRAQESAEAKDPFIHTYVSFGTGAAQKMALQFFRAEQSFREALALANADENSYIAVASRVNLADVLYLQARLHEAENVCRQSIRRYGETPDARDWIWTLSRISFQRNQLEEALQLADRAVELSQQVQDDVVHSRALLQRAMVYQAMGDRRSAQADLDSADQMARGLQDPMILRSVIRQRTLFAAEERDFASARNWLDVLAEYGGQPFPFFLSYARGRVLLVDGKYKEAGSAFLSALQSLQGVDFVLVRIEVQVWQAVCLQLLGQSEDADQLLGNAVQASQTENITRPFAEARHGLLPLLEENGWGEAGWVWEALGRNNEPVEISSLTRREREILELLAAGLSNREMTERLVIAEGTLKRHIANLYQKLGVHNRTQAIQRYQSL
jgi:LuxR family transcriptional regulator, maltose regulon positive regulatory protein